MGEFESLPTERRVKTDADQAKKLPVAELTKRPRVSSALRHDGVRAIQEAAAIIVDSYADVVKNSFVHSGKAALPDVGSARLQLRACRSRERIGQARSYSGGAGFLQNPKYMVAKMRPRGAVFSRATPRR